MPDDTADRAVEWMRANAARPLVQNMLLAARHRAACEALRVPVWREGMSAIRHRPGKSGDGVAELRIGWPSDAQRVDAIGCRPDFEDPATVGVLLAVARLAWDCPYLRTEHHGQQAYGIDRKPWRAWMPGEPVGYGATEAEAIVAAMEAAAERRPKQWINQSTNTDDK